MMQSELAGLDTELDRIDRLEEERPGKVLRYAIVGGLIGIAAAGAIGYCAGNSRGQRIMNTRDVHIIQNQQQIFLHAAETYEGEQRERFLDAAQNWYSAARSIDLFTQIKDN